MFFAISHLVLSLDRNLLAHLLSFRVHVVIIPMRLVYETVEAIVNGLLVSLVDLCNHVWSGLRKLSHMRRAVQKQYCRRLQWHVLLFS